MNATNPRNDAFDIVKGVLVSLMVIYHVMNISSTAGPDDYLYIRFLSGSFIFVSGVIISRFVAGSFAEAPAAATRRLLVRGVKILLIFSALNLAIHATGFGNPSKEQLGAVGLLGRLDTIYLRGNSGITSFQILLPIAYTLLIAPIFLLVAGPTRRYASMAMLGLVLLCAIVLVRHPVSAIADFMLVGISGMCLGALPRRDSPAHPSSLRTWSSYVGLVVSLWLSARLSSNIATYAVGVALITTFLLECAQRVPSRDKFARASILLGRYSLFAYIAQIAIIQCFYRATGYRQWDLGVEVAGIMVGTIGLLLLVCRGLDELRARSRVVDRAYRLVRLARRAAGCRWTEPLIATSLCFAFMFYLFRSDPRQEGATTFALWIPFLWMFFAGSRYLSAWLSFDATEAVNYDEGSPLDRLVFLGLIVGGALVLARRDLDWGSLLGRNKLFVIYLFYCLLSTTWSSDPSISLKRWFKDLGNPLMALIILTEPIPMVALATLVRRLSYLLLPLSVLFVRYYPGLGRVYGVDGTSMYTGVGQQKNALGQMCLVIGIYFLWQILADRRRYLDWTREQRLCLLTLLAMLGWLQYMSNSQTALASLFVVAVVLLCSRLPAVQRSPARLVNLSIFAAIAFIALESVFDIKNVVIGLLGRDPSLTSRTDLWAVLYSFSKDPVLGVGFMSFWSGERMGAIWSEVGAGVLQAHSGYLEQYLNLGFVGFGLMALVLFRGLFSIRRQLRDDATFGVLRLCFLSAAILSNYTEASFYGINNIWVITLLAVLEVPPRGSHQLSRNT